MARGRHAQPLGERREIDRRIARQAARAHDPVRERRDARRVELPDRTPDLRARGPSLAGERVAHALRDRVQLRIPAPRIGCCAVQRDEAREPALRRVAEHDRRGRRDARMRAQRRIDLRQLDPITANLHLVVLPAEKFERTVGATAAEVARAIQPPPVRVAHEALGGTRRIVRIAGRQPDAADVDLAAHAGRTRPAERVEHVHRLPGQRAAVRNAREPRVFRPDRMLDRPDRRLGRAAQAEQPAVRPAAPPARRQAHRNPVARPHHATWPGHRAGRLAFEIVDEHLPLRGHRVPQRDAVARDQFGPVRRIVAARRVRQHDACAARGRAEQIVDGQIEAQFGEPEHRVARAHRVARVDVGERVADGRMAHHHALGLARRARRVDHVRERIAFERMRIARRPPRIGRQRIDIDARATIRLAVECALRHDRADLRVAQDRPPPQRGLPVIDGHVRRARLHDAEHRDELVRALRHPHRDLVAGRDARALERGAHRGRALRDVAIGVRARRVDHDGRIGRASRLRGKARREVAVRVRMRARDGRLGRQHDVARARPPRGVAREPREQCDVSVEHRGRHAGGEQIVAHVPADLQVTELIGDLAVEPDLRCLTDHVARRRRARAVLAVLAEQPPDAADTAREHDGHQRRVLAAPPRELAHHLDARECAMVEIVEHLRADRARALGEIAPLRDVDGEQAQGGEIAEHRVDLRMHGRAIQHREVQAERGRLAPAADHLGERGERDARRAQPEAARERDERVPTRAIEPRMAVREARPRIGAALRRPRQHRQVGASGQAVDAREPPSGVARMLRAPAGARFVDDVIAKRHVERRGLPLRIVMAATPFREQQLQARIIDQREIDGQVQHRAVGPDAHLRLQHGPAIERVHRVVEALAHAAHVRVERSRVCVAQIVHRERLPRHVGQDALPRIVLDDRAQHRMARDAGVPRGLEAPHVEIGGLAVFDVQMARAAAELERRVAAEHVGGLHGRQREPLVGARRLRAPRAVAQEADERGALRVDPRGERRVERARRRAVAQLLAVAPQFDLPLAAGFEHVLEAHSTPSSIAAACAARCPRTAAAAPASFAARPASVGSR
ncbi:hypothetical protein DP43_6458 [Burkholderia pseudomallei]|nr:hypothetical protein DP43_6458 [Burkholderia pseudomallei]